MWFFILSILATLSFFPTFVYKANASHTCLMAVSMWWFDSSFSTAWVSPIFLLWQSKHFWRSRVHSTAKVHQFFIKKNSALSKRKASKWYSTPVFRQGNKSGIRENKALLACLHVACSLPCHVCCNGQWGMLGWNLRVLIYNYKIKMEIISNTISPSKEYHFYL